MSTVGERRRRGIAQMDQRSSAASRPTDRPNQSAFAVEASSHANGAIANANAGKYLNL